KGLLNTVTLATSNQITASQLAISTVGSSVGSDGGDSILRLGQTNDIRVGSIAIANSGRSDGTLNFATAGSSAVIRNTDGSSPVTTWSVGHTNQAPAGSQEVFTAL